MGSEIWKLVELFVQVLGCGVAMEPDAKRGGWGRRGGAI